MSQPERSGKGPFRPEHVKPGDRYEISEGHAVYCAPTGGDGARRTILAAEILDTDPAVSDAGIDAGYRLDDETMRAPDVAVGHVPDAPGWLKGAPPLAVEYAGTGQDEPALQTKIAQLLAAGTRLVWVVRLVGPRRIEVYEQARPMRIVGPGSELSAPGILENPIPLDAFYERTVAHEVALRNLLQRRGYSGLDQLREEGREEGRDEGREEARIGALREAVRDLAEVLGIEWTDERAAAVMALDRTGLGAMRDVLKRERRWPT